MYLDISRKKTNVKRIVSKVIDDGIIFLDIEFYANAEYLLFVLYQSRCSL